MLILVVVTILILNRVGSRIIGKNDKSFQRFVKLVGIDDPQNITFTVVDEMKWGIKLWKTRSLFSSKYSRATYPGDPQIKYDGNSALLVHYCNSN